MVNETDGDCEVDAEKVDVGESVRDAGPDTESLEDKVSLLLCCCDSDTEGLSDNEGESEADCSSDTEWDAEIA